MGLDDALIDLGIFHNSKHISTKFEWRVTVHAGRVDLP